MPTSDPALEWLLRSRNPSVRYAELTELAGASASSPEAERLCRAIPRSPMVRALLAGQRSDGGFGVHPYKKWDGAHWRLVSLVELGLPVPHPRIHGLVRRCASQEGNVLRAADGLWHADGRWWRPPGSGGATVEVVDWGPSAPSEMITLNALRVLHAAGRLR